MAQPATPEGNQGSGSSTTATTTTSITTSGTDNALPGKGAANPVQKKNPEKYQLMEGDNDNNGDDQKKQNEDNKDIDKIDIKNQPFGGYEIKRKGPALYLKSDIILDAINKMKRDINLSDFECKENEKLLEDHFNTLIETISNKKLELISKLNKYYDDNNEDTKKRINELNTKYNKELEVEKLVDPNELLEKSLKEISQKNEKENIFKRQITKLKSKKNIKIDDQKNNNIAAKEHDKMRVFFPTKALNKLIDEEIRVANEWWNRLKINFSEYNLNDSEVWRIGSGSGFFNAFGSQNVGITQKKRWDVRILPKGNCDLSKPVDIVLGIIESDKAITRNKKNIGFWKKGFDGYGYYGHNGRIFNEDLADKGISFGPPFKVNSVIGIELDMTALPDDDQNGNKKNKKKNKPKANSSKNAKKGILFASGATLTFFVDDKEIGIAFYNLDLTKEYSLAVAIQTSNYILKLL